MQIHFQLQVNANIKLSPLLPLEVQLLLTRMVPVAVLEAGSTACAGWFATAACAPAGCMFAICSCACPVLCSLIFKHTTWTGATQCESVTCIDGHFVFFIVRYGPVGMPVDSHWCSHNQGISKTAVAMALIVGEMVPCFCFSLFVYI